METKKHDMPVRVYLTRNLPIIYHQSLKRLAIEMNVSLEQALNHCIRVGYYALKNSDLNKEGNG